MTRGDEIRAMSNDGLAILLDTLQYDSFVSGEEFSVTARLPREYPLDAVGWLEWLEHDNGNLPLFATSGGYHGQGVEGGDA